MFKLLILSTLLIGCAMDSKITQQKFKLNNGTEKTLADYKGKVVLVVNVASKCGLTPQYEGLEKIYGKYKDQGLTIIGFPANEFLAQEPGSNEEIAEFCKINYGVTFPLAQKIVVKGEGQHPLYKFMTAEKPKALKKEGGNLEERLASKNLYTPGTNDIMWNFEKFLFDREGKLVERFAPDIAPEDQALVKAIEAKL